MTESDKSDILGRVDWAPGYNGKEIGMSDETNAVVAFAVAAIFASLGWSAWARSKGK